METFSSGNLDFLAKADTIMAKDVVLRNMDESGLFYLYLHFHCESLNEPVHLRCGSYLHEQVDLSHTHIRAIRAG